MATKLTGYQRWAVVAKDSGRVISIRNERHERVPYVDPEKYDAIKVSGNPRRLAPTDVRPGMARRGDRFVWPNASGGQAA